MVPMANAQTPDGQTPAEETVCDPLKVDGITKGLYGLCVAFCEAQDFADEDEAITQEELLALEADTPSTSILANYNKKRDRADNGLDPDMPCIKVEAPCPCWNEQQVADTLATILVKECRFDGTIVRRLGGTYTRPDNSTASASTLLQAVHNPHPVLRHSCRFRNTTTGAITSNTNLTHTEAASCLSSVNAACDN